MCGRYTIYMTLEELTTAFMLDLVKYDAHVRRYNVAPTQVVPAIRTEEGKRVLSGYKWGLIPYSAKDPKVGYKMINARAETIQQNKLFRSLLNRRRVVVPSTGYYEWRREGKEKQPYLFQLKLEESFGFAGLYSTWESPSGETIDSCTIITTQPNELAEQVHDRMPVILDKTGVDAWLDPENTDKDILQDLLVPFPAKEMKMRPVSKEVNNARVEHEGLIKELVINSK